MKGGTKRILAALALSVLPGAAAVSDALALAITRPQEQIVANDIAPARAPYAHTHGDPEGDSGRRICGDSNSYFCETTKSIVDALN